MKCDELNYKMIRVDGKVIGVCLATEVDEAIAELKAENEKLTHDEEYFCLDCDVVQDYADNLKNVMAENEKLKAQFNPLYEELKRIKDENEAMRSKNEGLLYALADAETDLAMSTRWRKCSEELPQNGQDVWAYDSKSKSVLHLEYEKSNEGEGFIVFPYKHDFLQNITQWMPFEKPKAPEVK